MTIMSTRKFSDARNNDVSAKTGSTSDADHDNNNHYSRQTSGSSYKNQHGDGSHLEKATSPYEKLVYNLSKEQFLKEVTLGRRIGFYKVRGELGAGNFSSVKLGIHSLTREKVAIKILDKTKLDQKTQRLLSREISSMEKLRHPNIIRLYEVIDTLAKLHIVMEYAKGGELFTKISTEGKLPENDAKIIFAQIVSAVDHMHANGVIHRDLKAENVFYATPNMVKLGDFGFSTQTQPDQTLNTFCGSPPYAAPELFRDESYLGVFVDVWALGVMLYFTVTGIMPFRAETVAKLKKCILEGSFSLPSYLSESCVELLTGILKPIPSERLKLADLKTSQWLNGTHYPEAFAPFELNPSGSGERRNADENEARAILEGLGVGPELLRETSGRESRSSITGVYRIVLHRIQKRGTIEQEDVAESAENLAQKDKENRIPNTQNKKSRFCTIL